jgi:inner membrane protease subunit 2
MAARAAAFVRSVLFTLPAAVAVNELLFSVLRVEGRSMQPALNPGPPGGPAQSAAGTPQPDCEWVLVDKASVKLLRRYERGGVYVFWRALLLLRWLPAREGGGRGAAAAAGSLPRRAFFPSALQPLTPAPRRNNRRCRRAPDDPHEQLIKRLVGLEGDVLYLPRSHEAKAVPQGRCWLEGDNGRASVDSASSYGPIHLGLLEGRATHVVWPPGRARRLADAMPPHRLLDTGRSAPVQ